MSAASSGLISSSSAAASARRQVLEQTRRHFGLQLDEDVGRLGWFEAGDQVAKGLVVEFFEDGGRRSGGRLGQSLPFFAVGVEILLDSVGFAARLNQQLPGKLERAAKSEFHRGLSRAESAGYPRGQSRKGRTSLIWIEKLLVLPATSTSYVTVSPGRGTEERFAQRRFGRGEQGSRAACWRGWRRSRSSRRRQNRPLSRPSRFRPCHRRLLPARRHGPGWNRVDGSGPPSSPGHSWRSRSRHFHEGHHGRGLRPGGSRSACGLRSSIPPAPPSLSRRRPE